MGFLNKVKEEPTCTISSGDDQQYVVLQVALKQKLFGNETTNLLELETVINNQARKGYKLHTLTTSVSANIGAGNSDRTHAIMVFERL